MTRWLERYHDKLKARQHGEEMKWERDDVVFVMTGTEDLMSPDDEDPTGD